jgi:hypothetical protein
VVATASAAAIVAVPSVAWADYLSSTSAAMTVSAGTLAPPTNVSATAKCTGSNPSVTVTWTATSSTFATGYTVTLTPTTGSKISTNVNGRTTTSTTIPMSRSGKTYTPGVVSTVSTWTSAIATGSPIVC